MQIPLPNHKQKSQLQCVGVLFSYVKGMSLSKYLVLTHCGTFFVHVSYSAKFGYKWLYQNDKL